MTIVGRLLTLLSLAVASISWAQDTCPMGPNGVYVCPPTIVTAPELDPFDLPNSSNSGIGPGTTGFPSIPPPIGGVPIFVGNYYAPINPGLYVSPGPPSDLSVREQAQSPWRILDGEARPAFTRDKTLVIYSLIGNSYFGSRKSDVPIDQLSVWNSTPDSLVAFAYEARLSDALPKERRAIHLATDLAQTTPIDKDKLVAKIDSIATKASNHICAKNCRIAFEAAGMNTAGHPVDAKDYGPFLLSHGATNIAMDDQYQPQKGDVIVFEGTDKHKHGHIEIFDGSIWVSDFKQRGVSPYPLSETPSFQIFRFRDQLEVRRP
ncbi:MAG: CHAP domain-containing protein [Candidatus Sulfotelmatobacter sp.]